MSVFCEAAERQNEMIKMRIAKNKIGIWLIVDGRAITLKIFNTKNK